MTKEKREAQLRFSFLLKWNWMVNRRKRLLYSFSTLLEIEFYMFNSYCNWSKQRTELLVENNGNERRMDPAWSKFPSLRCKDNNLKGLLDASGDHRVTLLKSMFCKVTLVTKINSTLYLLQKGIAKFFTSIVILSYLIDQFFSS